MSLAHGDVLGLNRDSLAIDRATDSVAEDNEPLVLNFLVFGHKDAVLVAARDSLQALHVLHMLLVYRGIPENDAHIVSFGLAEGKNKRAGEVAPHIVWLDVGEQDIRVDGQSDSQTVTFPGYSVNHTSEGGHTKGSQVLAKGGVELDARFMTFDLLDTRTRDGDNVAIGVPLDVLDEHASVDENWRIIRHVPHQLHTTALVSDAESWGLLILILVRETLTI